MVRSRNKETAKVSYGSRCKVARVSEYMVAGAGLAAASRSMASSLRAAQFVRCRVQRGQKG